MSNVNSEYWCYWTSGLRAYPPASAVGSWCCSLQRACSGSKCDAHRRQPWEGHVMASWPSFEGPSEWGSQDD